MKAAWTLFRNSSISPMTNIPKDLAIAQGRRGLPGIKGGWRPRSCLADTGDDNGHDHDRGGDNDDDENDDNDYDRGDEQ